MELYERYNELIEEALTQNAIVVAKLVDAEKRAASNQALAVGLFVVALVELAIIVTLLMGGAS